MVPGADEESPWRKTRESPDAHADLGGQEREEGEASQWILDLELGEVREQVRDSGRVRDSCILGVWNSLGFS